MHLKRMGVINLTPNSFSDGGELLTPAGVEKRILSFGTIDALDVGAESTAPFNSAIGASEEWKRLDPFLPLLKSLKIPLSIDTYHVETIERIAHLWHLEQITTPLIWNDVSGKFDNAVKSFLKQNKNFYYVFCHNLAPSRELTTKHMEYLSAAEGEAFLGELTDYFLPYVQERVIFDPTLGFSKTYEQNWTILNGMKTLQEKIPAYEWLLGFSRKSFLRKKMGVGAITAENRESIDIYHQKVLNDLKGSLKGSVWVRTHRPEFV